MTNTTLRDLKKDTPHHLTTQERNAIAQFVDGLGLHADTSTNTVRVYETSARQHHGYIGRFKTRTTSAHSRFSEFAGYKFEGRYAPKTANWRSEGIVWRKELDALLEAAKPFLRNETEYERERIASERAARNWFSAESRECDHPDVVAERAAKDPQALMLALRAVVHCRRGTMPADDVSEVLAYDSRALDLIAAADRMALASAAHSGIAEMWVAFDRTRSGNPFGVAA